MMLLHTVPLVMQSSMSLVENCFSDDSSDGNQMISQNMTHCSTIQLTVASTTKIVLGSVEMFCSDWQKITMSLSHLVMKRLLGLVSARELTSLCDNNHIGKSVLVLSNACSDQISVIHSRLCRPTFSFRFSLGYDLKSLGPDVSV